MAKMGKAIEARFADTRKPCEKLRARGGKIVFVRFPNSGELKALEDRLTPRARDLGSAAQGNHRARHLLRRLSRSWRASPVPSGRIFPPAIPSSSPSASFRIFALR